jgi:hypothetical protein
MSVCVRTTARWVHLSLLNFPFTKSFPKGRKERRGGDAAYLLRIPAPRTTIPSDSFTDPLPEVISPRALLGDIQLLSTQCKVTLGPETIAELNEHSTRLGTSMDRSYKSALACDMNLSSTRCARSQASEQSKRGCVVRETSRH